MKNQVNTIDIDGISIAVIRSPKRKTVSISVKDGNVAVSVPSAVSNAYIRDVLIKKINWIKRKVAEFRERPPAKVRKYLTGERFDYLGESLQLQLVEDNDPSVLRQGNQLVLALPKPYNFAENIKHMLSVWYHNQAIGVFSEKVQYFASIIGVEPSGIEIKKYKARWGSCTIHAKVQFNWKLMMAPHYVVDYVVVHELCHILEHNHSPAFWSHVQRVYPRYPECKQWLKDNGHLLEV